jgi:hypothetical protein
MKLTTKSIENDKKSKRKWTRYNARSILTPLEERKLKNGTWKYDRHLRLQIKVKTMKALYNDLPIVLNTLKPKDFVDYALTYSVDAAIPPTERFIKALLFYYYRMKKYTMMSERNKAKRKVKVAPRQVWQVVNKTIKDAKKEAEAKYKTEYEH